MLSLDIFMHSAALFTQDASLTHDELWPLLQKALPLSMKCRPEQDGWGFVMVMGQNHRHDADFRAMCRWHRRRGLRGLK